MGEERVIKIDGWNDIEYQGECMQVDEQRKTQSKAKSQESGAKKNQLVVIIDVPE